MPPTGIWCLRGPRRWRRRRSGCYGPEFDWALPRGSSPDPGGSAAALCGWRCGSPDEVAVVTRCCAAWAGGWRGNWLGKGERRAPRHAQVRFSARISEPCNARHVWRVELIHGSRIRLEMRTCACVDARELLAPSPRRPSRLARWLSQLGAARLGLAGARRRQPERAGRGGAGTRPPPSCEWGGPTMPQHIWDIWSTPSGRAGWTNSHARETAKYSWAGSSAANARSNRYHPRVLGPHGAYGTSFRRLGTCKRSQIDPELRAL
jgi:hypothetical protein